MRFQVNNFGILVLIVLSFSCKSFKINVLEGGDSFILEDYSSFSFYQVEAEGVLSPDYQGYMDFLKEEIAKQMAYRGVLRKEDGAALWINIGVLVEEETQTRETGLVTDPGTFTYIGQRRYTWKTETIEVGTYKKGTVTVHFVDSEKNEAVWVGVTEEILANRPDKIRESITKGVEEMFKLIN